MLKSLRPSVIFCLVIQSFVVSASTRDIYIPPQLEPWKDWVLEGKEYLDCPFFFDQTAAESSSVCAWPGLLNLEIDGEGGRFDQTWIVYAGENWLPWGWRCFSSTDLWRPMKSRLATGAKE